jgi:hypothetical protein
MKSGKSWDIAEILAKAADEERDQIIRSLQLMNEDITYSGQDFDRKQYLSAALYDAGVR